MDYKKLANLLFPNVIKSVSDWQAIYSKRDLPEGAHMTRVAPSPTGFLHIGTLFQAAINSSVAKKSNGVFFLRVEDTDKKREIQDAAKIAFDMLKYYGVAPDEGFNPYGNDIGNFGPYLQSKRKEIYESFAKHIVELGNAFPCFCKKTENKSEILERRELQLEESEEITGHDICRDLTIEEIEIKLNNGEAFALRLKSTGDEEKTFKFKDLIKGEKEIRENGKDIILIKSDGIPPYAFAHLVDDTLMQTTIVVRGEEWFPSLSAHLELFRAFAFKAPKYAHTPVICKLNENGNKKKLSKRSDIEADARFFITEGYPVETVMQYLCNLANSNFETWKSQNPLSSYKDFELKLSNVGSNNPMFDMLKLADMSKNIISKIPANELFENISNWAKEFNLPFYKILTENKDISIKMLEIDRTGAKPRKDIAKWSDVENLFCFMFKELYDKLEINFEPSMSNETITNVLRDHLMLFDQNHTKEEWFNSIKNICEKNTFATGTKEYKLNPDKYLGSVKEVSNIIRMAITGKTESPDLYFIENLLGKAEIERRIQRIIFAFKIISENQN